MSKKRLFKPWKIREEFAVTTGESVFQIACSDHIRADTSGFLSGSLAPFDIVPFVERTYPSSQTRHISKPPPPKKENGSGLPLKTVIVRGFALDPFSMSRPDAQRKAFPLASLLGNSKAVKEIFETVGLPIGLRGSLRVLLVCGPVGVGKTTCVVSACMAANRCCTLFDFGEAGDVERCAQSLFPARNRVVVARYGDALRDEGGVAGFVDFVKGSVIDSTVESNLLVVIADTSFNPLFSGLRCNREDFENGFCRLVFFDRPGYRQPLNWFSEWNIELTESVLEACAGDLRKASICAALGQEMAACLMRSDGMLDPFVITQMLLGGGPSVPRLLSRSDEEASKVVLACCLDPETVLDVVGTNYLSVWKRDMVSLVDFSDGLSQISCFMGRYRFYYDDIEIFREAASIWILLLTSGSLFSPFYSGARKAQSSSPQELRREEPLTAAEALERCF